MPKDRIVYGAFDFQKRARDKDLRMQQQELARQANEETKAVAKKPKLVKPTVIEKYDE